jgi:hypothetical protein
MVLNGLDYILCYNVNYYHVKVITTLIGKHEINVTSFQMNWISIANGTQTSPCPLNLMPKSKFFKVYQNYISTSFYFLYSFTYSNFNILKTQSEWYWWNLRLWWSKILYCKICDIFWLINIDVDQNIGEKRLCKRG